MSSNNDKEQGSNKMEMIRLVLNEKKSLNKSCKAIAEELEG